MMDDTPKCCPFCSSKLTTVEQGSRAVLPCWYVLCGDCGGTSGKRGVRSVALRDWNTASDWVHQYREDEDSGRRVG